MRYRSDALFRQVDTRADADGEADDARDSDQREGADDRVRHAAARLPNWSWHVGEELE